MRNEMTRRLFLERSGSVAAGAAIGSGVSAAESSETLSARPIKIVGICCSPRKGKTTATALQVCLDAAKAFASNIEVELVELAGMRIPGCVAAGIALEPGERDDFPALIPKLTEAKVAGIIVGTPVYFGNMSYLCKAFLDRCIVFHQDAKLGNKVAGVVAVGGGRNGGQELTVRSVQVSLMSQQMLVVGDGKPTGHWGGTVMSGGQGGVADDEFGMSTCRNLGRRVAEVASHMAALAPSA